jgi:hypothetical protein
MASGYGAQNAEVMIGPVAGVAVTAGNGAAGTSVDLSAYRGRYVALRFPGKTHIRFGASGAVAAATTDLYLVADEIQVFKIVSDLEFVNAWGVGAAHAGVAAVVSR